GPIGKNCEEAMVGNPLQLITQGAVDGGLPEEGVGIEPSGYGRVVDPVLEPFRIQHGGPEIIPAAAAPVGAIVNASLTQGIEVRLEVVGQLGEIVPFVSPSTVDVAADLQQFAAPGSDSPDGAR